MHVGERIAELRRAKKWSQTKLANRLGITQTAVHFWEKGGLPEFSRLGGIARVLRTSRRELERLYWANRRAA